MSAARKHTNYAYSPNSLYNLYQPVLDGNQNSINVSKPQDAQPTLKDLVRSQSKAGQMHSISSATDRVGDLTKIFGTTISVHWNKPKRRKKTLSFFDCCAFM